MEYRLLNSVELATTALIPFRQILDEIVIKKGLKIPKQLDIMVDSVLMGHFLSYSHNIFRADIYNESFVRKVVSHIYQKNHNKLISPTLKEDSYSFPIEKYIPNFKMDFFKIHIEQPFAAKLIQDTIEQSRRELNKIIRGHSVGEKIIPSFFFFNCFVHPSLMVNNSYKNYEKIIDSYSVDVFNYLLIEIPLYLQDFLNKIKIK